MWARADVVFATTPQNKEAEAKEELKRRAKQLEMQRREQQRRQQGGGGGGGAGGFGGSGGFGAGSGGMAGGYQAAPRFDPVPAERDPYRWVRWAVGSALAHVRTCSSSSPAPAASKPAFKGTGMKLGSKKGKQSELLDALGGEAAVPDEPEQAAVSPAPASAPAPPPAEDNLPRVQQSR